MKDLRTDELKAADTEALTRSTYRASFAFYNTNLAIEKAAFEIAKFGRAWDDLVELNAQFGPPSS